MNRISLTFPISDIKLFKSKLLKWGNQHSVFSWLDSNNYQQKHSSFEAVLAVEAISSIECSYHGAFEKLKKYRLQTKDYIFGFLGYDLKNDLEDLHSKNYDGLHFPDLFFFQPKKIIKISEGQLIFSYLEASQKEIKSDFERIEQIDSRETAVANSDIKIKLRIHKDSYFQKIDQVLKHIARGDFYEANFCQEFYAENTTIDPISVYEKLNAISTPPFATCFKINDKYLLSASPERYLKKVGNHVISQPIKGTEKRASNEKEDAELLKNLESNPKERAENIMIVDLVRNDLSRIAKKGTVVVDELCKVYSFRQVHQLISTISCEVNPDVDAVEIIKNSFPMGSMTGAPKIAAMKIMEQLEETKRGLYSGAVGYFTPENDFDFNVIIRSILYNAQNRYISYSVGGAITNKSVPEKEYEECLLKAKAMKEVLLN